jgi:hypothetical protein
MTVIGAKYVDRCGEVEKQYLVCSNWPLAFGASDLIIPSNARDPFCLKNLVIAVIG